jgi:hypothetical protein
MYVHIWRKAHSVSVGKKDAFHIMRDALPASNQSMHCLCVVPDILLCIDVRSALVIGAQGLQHWSNVEVVVWMNFIQCLHGASKRISAISGNKSPCTSVLLTYTEQTQYSPGRAGQRPRQALVSMFLCQHDWILMGRIKPDYITWLMTSRQLGDKPGLWAWLHWRTIVIWLGRGAIPNWNHSFRWRYYAVTLVIAAMLLLFKQGIIFAKFRLWNNHSALYI